MANLESVIFPAAQSPTSGTGPYSFSLAARLKFTKDKQINAIAFWKGPMTAATHVCKVWDDVSSALATAIANSEVGAGWQVARLATPLVVTSGTYVRPAVETVADNYAIELVTYPISISDIAVPSAASDLSGAAGYPETIDTTNYFYVDVITTDVGVVLGNTTGNTTSAAKIQTLLQGGALKIGFIGDSITAGTNVDAGYDPVSAFASFATSSIPGCTSVVGVNRGISGASTANWLPTATVNYYAPAVTAMSAAGCNCVHIMLGTNDSNSGNAVSPTTFAANLTTIAGALITSGFSAVFVSYIPFAGVGAGSGLFDQPSVDREVAYQAAIDGVVNGTTIFQGDREAFEYTLYNPAATKADGVHPNDTGSLHIGQLWATALSNLLTGPSLTLASNLTQGNAGTVFTISGTASGMTGGGTLTVSDTYGTLSAASIIIANNGTFSFTDTRTAANLTAATTVLLTDSSNATGSGSISLTTNLMAIPTNLSVTTNGLTTVSLIADETTGAATQILVQTAPASGFPTWTRRGTLTLAAGVAFGTIGGLAPATGYKVRVYGIDAYGNNSFATDSISPPTFTTWGQILGLAITKTGATWTDYAAGGGTGYQISIGGGAFSATGISGTTYVGTILPGQSVVVQYVNGTTVIAQGQAWQLSTKASLDLDPLLDFI